MQKVAKNRSNSVPKKVSVGFGSNLSIREQRELEEIKKNVMPLLELTNIWR
jgi:hypothetical protein